jgi:uncharacterized protein (TIGR03437 family)
MNCRGWILLNTFAVLALPGSAQLASLTAVLDIELANETIYYYDEPDVTKFASEITPRAPLGNRNFTQFIAIDEITAVNGVRAKGVYVARGAFLRLAPGGDGSVIADVTRFATYDATLEILQEDGTPIGSIIVSGLWAGAPPPGIPTGPGTSGNLAVVGGTGAYAGARGVMVQAPQKTPGNARRATSVIEDPAQRRAKSNGGYQRYLVYLSPMIRPEVVVSADGLTVFHEGFVRVSDQKPARAGETLILAAHGIGPTVPPLDVGQVFTQSPLAVVNSPVVVHVNRVPAEVVNKIGWPGTSDTYRIDVRLPDNIPAGAATLQISAGFIDGTEIRIPIR